MEFIRCIVYLAVIGIIGFIVGRLLPKSLFFENAFPFTEFKFEKNGKFYEQFKIRLWKDKIMDMSKIFPKIMPVKQLREDIAVYHTLTEKITVLVKETCIAEFIHTMLAIVGFGCMKIWEGLGGTIVAILYAVGNIPFIMVQRYNRPRLISILNKKRKKPDFAQTPGNSIYENANVDVKI